MKDDTKLNISEYYSSILDDESNALVLAWIEKSGTTSEEELSKETALDEKYVKNIILKLFRNQLIEISKNFLQVSLKGKTVIDSLKISNEIIKNFYSSLNLDTKEEIFLNYSLNHYRHNYYHSYLNTCNSLKTWDRIINSSKFTPLDKKDSDESYLLIIISDLFKTLYINDENPNIKSFKIFLEDLNVDFTEKEEKSFKSRNAFRWLKELYTIKSKHEFNKYDISKREVFEFIICKDLYLNDEKEQHKLLFEFKNSRENKLNENTFITYHSWKNKWLDNIDFDITIPNRYSQIFLNKNFKQNDKDFWDTLIFLLENSESIKDLSIAINKPFDETNELISKIEVSINNLRKKNFS